MACGCAAGPARWSHPAGAYSRLSRIDNNAPAAPRLEIASTITCASGRQERAAGARAHANFASAVHRPLRDNVQNSIEMAITDALTGLAYRRYMESHLERWPSRRRPAASRCADDARHRFFQIDQRHSTATTPATTLLREFAVRVRKSIAHDLACAMAAEEFVIVMPETDLHVAGMVAERLRRSKCRRAFASTKRQNGIEVTISIGLSAWSSRARPSARAQARRHALYRAKHDGRNRVVRSGVVEL